MYNIIDRLVQYLEGNGVLHGQAGFRVEELCRNTYALNELVQVKLRDGKKTDAFFLEVQKAYDIVCHNVGVRCER